eukprot:SAG22_NODE_1784_length_3588_cov_27.751791_3_plen_102_part_00
MSTFTNIGFFGRAATHASQLFARAELSDQCLPSSQRPSVVGAFCAPLVTRQPSTTTGASATSATGGGGGDGGGDGGRGGGGDGGGGGGGSGGSTWKHIGPR